MKYYTYEVDSKYISSENTIEWSITGSGEQITGTKGGKKYFIKRNSNIRKPTHDMSEALYKLQKTSSDYVEHKQELLSKLMRGLTVDGDHVVVEEENFWDRDNMFVTVTRFIEGAMPDNSPYKDYSQEIKNKLFIDMATLIGKLHDRKIIHGDLKEKNFLFKKSGDSFIVYVLDFDSSYAAEEIPDYDKIVYSDNYQSPEVAWYIFQEDETLRDTVTYKTDVFTLGVIFHCMWTGSFPATELEKGCCGEARCMDKEIYLDRSLDVLIGNTTKATYISLINWMLTKEPESRPTIKQVIDVLSDNLSIPEAYIKGKDEKVFTGLWDCHKDLTTYSEDDLKAKGIDSFRKINDGGVLKYVIHNSDGEVRYTIQQLIEKNILPKVDAVLSDTWEDHEIKFADMATINSQGYASIEKIMILGKKLYLLSTLSGLQFTKSKEGLINSGLAIPIIHESPVSFAEPWPEDNAVYASSEYISSRNVTDITTVVIDGGHYYKVTYADGHENIVGGKTLLILGLIIKK